MRGVVVNVEDFAKRDELREIHHLQVSLLVQIDQVDRRVRRLRWWTLTLSLLVLCLTIIVWRLA